MTKIHTKQHKINNKYYSSQINNNEISNSNIDINFIKIFKYLHFSLENFTVNNFIQEIVNNFKLNTTYSILVKISCDNNSLFKMCGSQIGVIIKNEHDLKYYKHLYSAINNRIESVFDLYNYIEKIDTIEIMYSIIIPQPELALKNISNISLNKNLVAIKEVKKNFNENLLPLTINTSYFGSPILYPDRQNYLNLINSQNNINSNININKKDNKNHNDLKINDLDKMFIYQSPNNKDKFIIVSKKINNLNYIRFIYDFNTGILIKEIKDTIISGSNTDNSSYSNITNYDNISFNRNIDSVTLSIKDKDNISSIIIKNKLSIIKPLLNKKIDRNINFGTLDLETFVDLDGIAKVYALGFLTNIDKEAKLFYLTDLENKDYNKLSNTYKNRDSKSDINDLDHYNLILKCIDAMLVNKYNNFIFYVHNLGKYDVIFLYNILLKANSEKGFDYYILKTLMRDDKIIKLNIKINIHKLSLNEENNSASDLKKNKFIKISLVDSLNLLNNSLNKLAKDFNVETKKGYFPYTFVNKQNLNYIGQKPEKSYYSKITDSDYNNIINFNWNLKQECLSYLKDDLKSLLEVMNEFSNKLYINFNTQMTNALTISSLAMNIFLESFYELKVIPLINKSFLFNFIKEAYYGGITEVYKPYGKDLVYLDINSLYPFSSLNYLPGNDCTYLESFEDKGLDLDQLFGFFYTKVKTNNEYLGLLPIHSNDMLIFPNGEYYGIWSSEELKFAKENGYNITVIKGYNFNKVEGIFNNYVYELFKLKAKSTNSLRMIAKSLLNNLIGRFGLNLMKPITETVNSKKRDFIASTRNINSQKFLSNDKILLTYSPIISKQICQEHGLDYIKVLTKDFKTDIEKNLGIFKNVSIAISAMVNSYARIYMNKLKLLILNNGGYIYYSDTDSLVIDKKSLNILDQYIGNNLGQFKIEYFIKEAYFISNKTYCLVLEDDKIIIKSKGANNSDLNLNDFKNMYFNQKNIVTKKNNTKTFYDKATVILDNKDITLNYNSYTKREKIYNNEGIWIETKPLIFFNSDKN